MQKGRLTVVSVEFVEEEVDVFDIEVDQDHSFLVHGAVLHNCPRCGALDGRRWSLDGEPIEGNDVAFPGPTLHWGDRCVQLPVTKSWEELTGIKGIEDVPPGERASMGGPVSGNTTFESWLKDQDETTRLDVLGTERLKLWESGKLTLRDFMDQSGNALTLEQLRTM